MDVVLSLHVSADDGTVVANTPSAYVQWPAKVFGPASTEPAEAVAEFIDTALELVNTASTALDHFTPLARAPHDPTTTGLAPQEDDSDEPEVEHCRDCGRVTRVDDDPVDTDAADGWNGYCGSCADRREPPNWTDE
jgi:hypothetical protein